MLDYHFGQVQFPVNQPMLPLIYYAHQRVHELHTIFQAYLSQDADPLLRWDNLY